MNKTIFPITLRGQIHAAFIADYRTDTWYTMCGNTISDPATVEHRADTEVTCDGCDRALEPPGGKR